MSLHAGLPLWDPHWVIWTSFLLSVCHEVLGTNDRIGDWRSPIGLLPTPLKLKERDFLRGPVAKTSPFSAGGMGSMLGGGAKITHALQFSSVPFSRSVVSDSLQPHESQRARPPCPSPTPGVYSNSCPSSRWCHPAVSSSVVPSSSCPQSFPESGSFLMSQLFSSGGQSIGVSASTSVLPMNTQDWSPLGWTGWMSLQSKGLSRVFSNTTVQKHNFSALSFLHSPTLTSIHDHWKNHSLD